MQKKPVVLPALSREAADPGTSPARLRELASGGDVKLERILARNPSSPHDVLDRLSHHRERSIRRSVAENPAAPSEVLKRLGSQFPEELLRNPALDWLLIEQPDFFSDIPEQTLGAIAKRDTCTPEMIRNLVRGGHGKQLLRSIAQNERTPRNVLEEVIALNREQVWARFGVPVQDVSEVISGLQQHCSLRPAIDPSAAETVFWKAVCGRFFEDDLDEVSPAEARLLLKSGAPEWLKSDIISLSLVYGSRTKALNRFRVPVPILEVLACADDIGGFDPFRGKAERRLLSLIRKADNCPPWIARAKDSDQARRAVLENSEKSRIGLEEIAETASALTRLLLTSHPLWRGAGRVEILRSLAENSHVAMRVLAARHPEADAATLRLLAEDVSFQVVRALLESGSDALDGDVLRRIAQRVEGNPPEWIGFATVVLLHDIASHRNVPREFLDKLAQSGVDSALRDERLAPEVILRLASQGHQQIVGNPSASPQSLLAAFNFDPERALK